ncbi:MAG TPA: hypothetical protein ENN99_05485 [Chloroflexi bacterium]|nr:hypothetical protein [Chloroflexota bacterium]
MFNLSVSKVVGVILALVGIGVLLALGWSDSDLVHPISSIAEYQRDQLEMEREAQENAVDLRQYEILQAAQTQIEIQKLEEDARYREQRHEQDLKNRQEAHQQQMEHEQEQAALEQQLLRWGAWAAIVAGGLSMLALSVGISIRIARPRLVSVRAATDEWTPERKRRAIAAARRRERRHREAMLRGQEIEIPWSELTLQEMIGVPVGSDRGEGGNGANVRSLSPWGDYD